MSFKNKYLKYKKKYIILKKQLGGEVKESKEFQIKDMIISDNMNLKINGDIIRSFDFTKIESEIDNQELENYYRFRSLFTKHIFKRYSEINLQSDKINLILTTANNGGYGDIMALYKLYKLLNNFQKNKRINKNVRIILFLPVIDVEVVKNLLADDLELIKKNRCDSFNVNGTVEAQNKSKKAIHSARRRRMSCQEEKHCKIGKSLSGKSNKCISRIGNLETDFYVEWTNNIFSGSFHDLYRNRDLFIRNVIGEDETYLLLHCPVPFYTNDAGIYEYGYGGDNMTRSYKDNSYSLGLQPHELGIYLNDYDKLDSGNYILYFAYFANQDLFSYLIIFKYYLHLIIRDIYTNKKHQKRKSIFLILPGLGSDIYENWNFMGWNKSINSDKKFRIELTKIENYNLADYCMKISMIIRNKKRYVFEIFIYKEKDLSNERFNNLLKKSQKLVGCTGDQSFSETISQYKIPLYQALGHKVKFEKSFHQYIKQSGYSEYVKLIDVLKGPEDFKNEIESKWQNLNYILNNTGEYNSFIDQFKKEFKTDKVLLGFIKFLIMQKNDSDFINQEDILFKELYHSTDNFDDLYQIWFTHFNQYL